MKSFYCNSSLYIIKLNEVFIKGINDNRLSFYKTAKALLKNEDDVEDALQDALETAYKNIETLKEEKYNGKRTERPYQT